MKKAYTHLRKSDPILGRIVDEVGACRIRRRAPDFSTLARAIVFQQLNGTAAEAIYRRFVAALDRGRLTPRAVLRAPARKLRAAGLSLQKIKYMKDLAEKSARGTIRYRRLAVMSDEEVISTLTRVKGIGVWTAHMFLMFALRRPDILAVGDYGVRAAVKRAYGLADLPSAAELEKIARPWRPHATAACWYLWQSLKIKTPGDPQKQASPR